MVDPANTRAGARVAVRGDGYEGRVEPAVTFHALVGDLEYPMFIVTARAGEPVAAESGSGEDEFTFHRAKRIEAGHEA
jgi:hypothetical protein